MSGTSSQETAALEASLQALPPKPGVYLFKDASGTVLYVGKSVSLRNRVRSYFGSQTSFTPKLHRLMSRVADLEFVLTTSESEALILENTLIKRHKPQYNVRLKDDKTYPYLKIKLNEDWPQVFITRRVEPDGARYFGPFASAGSVRITLDLLKKLFPYRSCTRTITGKDPRPCLDYYIHRCLGPCIGACSKEEYTEVVHQVILFLEGKQDRVVQGLRRKMEAASETLEFEKAALVRDQLYAVERVVQEQRSVSHLTADADIVGMAREKDEAWVEVYFIRHGRLIGREHFILEGTQDETPAGILSSFTEQFYSATPSIPPVLFFPCQLEDQAIVQAWLGQKAGRKISLRVPRRGEGKRLLETVEANAREGLNLYRIKMQAQAQAQTSALEDLKEYLHLPHLPRRIECYDISNIQGTNPVGSMVVFQDGKPLKAHYRRFHIRQVEGIDDYAMMREMLQRRFKRSLDGTTAEPPSNGAGQALALTKTQTWRMMPDLILIDGGRGHLNTALLALRELGLHHLPIASIAKENEELYIHEVPEPIVLARRSPALFLVQRARDEAHRFAITYHRTLRSRASARSALDRVPGIGPRRRKQLLQRFGSVRGIREASVEALAEVPSMTRILARRLKEDL